MAVPVIRQAKAVPLTSPASFVAGAWQKATNNGSRLLGFVAMEANGVNGINMSAQDPAWLTLSPGTIRRQASALDELVMTAYQIKSSASRLSAERFNWTDTKYGTLILVEVSGSDPAQDIDTTNNAKNGGLSLIIPAPGVPASAVGLAFAWVVNANPASNQAVWIPNPGWTKLIDSSSGSNGSDRLRCDLYYRSVAAGDFPTIEVDLDGVTTRNLQGTIHVFSEAPTSPPPGPSAPTLTSHPVDGSTGSVSFGLSEPGT